MSTIWHMMHVHATNSKGGSYQGNNQRRIDIRPESGPVNGNSLVELAYICSW
jgi:hypothetical protein